MLNGEDKKKLWNVRTVARVGGAEAHGASEPGGARGVLGQVIEQMKGGSVLEMEALEGGTSVGTMAWAAAEGLV